MCGGRGGRGQYQNIRYERQLNERQQTTLVSRLNELETKYTNTQQKRIKARAAYKYMHSTKTVSKKEKERKKGFSFFSPSLSPPPFPSLIQLEVRTEQLCGSDPSSHAFSPPPPSTHVPVLQWKKRNGQKRRWKIGRDAAVFHSGNWNSAVLLLLTRSLTYGLHTVPSLLPCPPPRHVPLPPPHTYPSPSHLPLPPPHPHKNEPKLKREKTADNAILSTEGEEENPPFDIHF